MEYLSAVQSLGDPKGESRVAMTLIYCEKCPKLILIGNSLGRVGRPVVHPICEGDPGTTGDEEPMRDQRGEPMVAANGQVIVGEHKGHVHLLLPDEPWEPEKYGNIDEYIAALQVKYPKVEQKALVS
jgi:hypothetical protein